MNIGKEELLQRLEIAKKIVKDSSVITLEGYSKNPGIKPVQGAAKEKSSFRYVLQLVLNMPK